MNLCPRWLTWLDRTGASGYIGGDILSALVPKYPHFNYRVLVRSQESRDLI